MIRIPRAALVLVPLISAVPVLAQEPPPEVARSLFGEVIDVRVVNLEVVVVDGNGNRVFDLGPEDFRLRVDGEEVPIDYFTEIQGGRATSTPASVEGVALPVFEAGEAVGNRYLIFVDDFFAIGKHRDLVLDELIEQLPHLRPEDRMAIVAFDGSRLEMLSSWSGSQQALERALETAKERRAHGLRRRVERAGGFGGFGDGVHANRESRGQLERLTTAVVSTLRGFAQPPGRKILLLLSGGWPTGTFTERGQPLLGAAETDLRLLEPIAETANLIGYTVYPLDMPGLQARIPAGAGVAFSQAQAGPEADNPLDRLRFSVPDGSALAGDLDRLSALRVLARETGGRALLFGDRLEALPRVAEDSGSYYWLGFTVDRQRDDAAHRVEVEVLRPGLKTRARRGFRDLSRRAEVTMMAQSRLLFGTPGVDAELAIDVGPARRKGLSKMTVPLRVGVPVEALTFLPSQGSYVAEVELRLAVKDDSGAQSDIPIVPLRLAVDEPPVAGDRVFYETELKLRREPHELVISVHEPASGKILSSMVAVTP